MNAETGRYTRENWNSGRNKGEKHMPLCKMWQELINVGEEYASLSALGQHNCTAASVRQINEGLKWTSGPPFRVRCDFYANGMDCCNL
jgi:hypothetical protein